MGRRAWLMRAVSLVSALFGARKTQSVTVPHESRAVVDAMDPRSVEWHAAIVRQVRELRGIEKSSYGGSGKWKDIFQVQHEDGPLKHIGVALIAPAATYWPDCYAFEYGRFGWKPVLKNKETKVDA